MRGAHFRWYMAALVCSAISAHVDRESFAQPAKERARELEKEAEDAYTRGRYDIAVKQYRAAWQLEKSYRYICGIGRTQFVTGGFRDAAESLSICRRMLPKEESAGLRKLFEDDLKSARAQVGEITVDVNVPGAEVLVDGKLVGKLPRRDPIFVGPGQHGVEVRAPGYEPAATITMVRAGDSTRMAMPLYPEDPGEAQVAPAPPEQVAPRPKAAADARVPASSPVPAGVVRRSPEAPPASSGQADEAKKPARTAMLLTGFGLGVVGVAAGVGGFMAANDAREDAEAKSQALYEKESDHPCVGSNNYVACQEMRSARTMATALTVVGVAGIAVAAAGGALTVYEFVRSSSSAQKGNVRAAVAGAPRGGVLRISGSF